MTEEHRVVLTDPSRLNRRDFVLFFCVGLFMVSLVMAAITAVKVQAFHIGPFVLLVPAGTLAFGLTYLATDVISEVWGRGYALAVVFSGLILRFLMLFLTLYALNVEQYVGFIDVAEQWTPERQAALENILGSSNRINIAGMVAFGISALSDVLIFHFLRQRDAGKNRLWLRNNISTMVSQALNSCIFILVAFGGVFSWAQIASLILGQIIVKLSVAALDTPLIYVFRNLADGRRLLDFRG